MKVTGNDLAEAAKASKYNGISYAEMDCQSFVEHVLQDVGISHNWLGSNDMFRNMVDSVQTVQEIMKDFGGFVPAGYICFTVKNDGKEPKRYTDGVNAAHVGIVLDDNRVRHSTTGGVQYDTITNKRWTHAGKHKDIVYTVSDMVKKATIDDIYKILKEIKELMQNE